MLRPRGVVVAAGVTLAVYSWFVAVTDTPIHVQRRLTAVYSAMSGAERVALAAEMAEEATAIALAGIRSRRPELTDTQRETEWIRLLHGDDLADRLARCSSSS